MGCLPNNKDAVEKIYEIKGRDKSKPLILMSNKEDYLFPYVKKIPEKAKKLMDTYFPGALTLVLEKSDKTPYSITSNKNNLYQKEVDLIAQFSQFSSVAQYCPSL